MVGSSASAVELKNGCADPAWIPALLDLPLVRSEPGTGEIQGIGHAVKAPFPSSRGAIFERFGKDFRALAKAAQQMPALSVPMLTQVTESAFEE